MSKYFYLVHCIQDCFKPEVLIYIFYYFYLIFRVNRVTRGIASLLCVANQVENLHIYWAMKKANISYANALCFRASFRNGSVSLIRIYLVRK